MSDDLRGELRAIQERLTQIERDLRGSPHGSLSERVRVLEEARAASADLRGQVEDNRVAAAVQAALERAHADWSARRERERVEDGKALRGWLAVAVSGGVAGGSALGWAMQLLM